MIQKSEIYKTGEKALTEKQVNEFLSKIGTLYDEALFRVALSTGIRREDIVAIKQADVDIDNYQLSFYEHKKKRIRTVPLSESVAQKIRQHINVIGKNEWLFPSPYNSKQHITGKQVYNRFQSYLRAAGIEPRPFHALRSTCIKLCQKRGWSVEQTAKLVGDTIRVVQEHYTTPSTEELKQTAREKPII
ncbi:MAG: site-specific integrase [Candidatus Thermoplasmatota archaeon]